MMLLRVGLSAEAAEARTLFDCPIWPGCPRKARPEPPFDKRRECRMHATLRRYEGVDRERTEELTGKINDTLMPRLSELPGFNGYYLIESGDGVMTSISLFETSAQADESTRVAGEWVRDEKL